MLPPPTVDELLDAFSKARAELREMQDAEASAATHLQTIREDMRPVMGRLAEFRAELLKRIQLEGASL